MNHELELAYLVLEIPEPSSLDHFLEHLIGLAPGVDHPQKPDDAMRFWRNDGRVHRVIVQPGPANDAVAIGFEASDSTVFSAVCDRLRTAGFPTEERGEKATTDRRVDRLAVTRAPWGIDVEIVLHLEPSDHPITTPLMPSGFLTEGVGFGHVVFATTNFEESLRFIESLGLTRSDWLRTELAPGLDLEVQFFHCNERHHSLALARAPFELPQNLHHFMFEVNDRNDVGAAFDRVWESDLAIPMGLGRHDNDETFSFYVASPAGFLVEVGHGTRKIVSPWQDDRLYDRPSTWGHQNLRENEPK